jgi:hypothetical protein
MPCSFSYFVCRPSCRGGETGQAREIEMDLWLLASRRRADAVACVPTIESSLTPAGAAAVDRARTPLDHLCLSQLLRAPPLAILSLSRRHGTHPRFSPKSCLFWARALGHTHPRRARTMMPSSRPSPPGALLPPRFDAGAHRPVHTTAGPNLSS